MAALRRPSANPKCRPHSRGVKTFVIRLHEDIAGSDRTGADISCLRGVVDEVATGLRARFRNELELVAALMAAMGAGPHGPAWDDGDRAPGEPAPD